MSNDSSNTGPVENRYQNDIFMRRLDDLVVSVERGRQTLSYSPFLTPAEIALAGRYLSSRIQKGAAFFWGGHAQAERKRLFILPEYMGDMTDAHSLSEDPYSAFLELDFGEYAEVISKQTLWIAVTGSGYKNLSHRDFLGSILNMGIERDAIGDVVTYADNMKLAYLASGETIAGFLQSDLTRVGGDVVHVSIMQNGFKPEIKQMTQPINDTVASPRADCVIASLCRLSREQSKNLILSGVCQIDYNPVKNPDTVVSAPAVITVRGYGKYRLLSFDGVTSKGRMRLRAEKFI